MSNVAKLKKKIKINCHLSNLFSTFQLGKFFMVIKNIFIMKNLTDLRKSVETGVDTNFKYIVLE